MRKFLCLCVALFAGLSSSVTAEEFGTSIDMRAKGGASSTYYVPGQIEGLGLVDLMVDTGSGYTTINEEMLAVLQGVGQVRFSRHMRGRLANGSELEVPIYVIEAVSIGDACWLEDVEVAVFPGNTRPILGLNLLQRAAPFIFSVEPPQLVLSHCAEKPGSIVSAELAARRD